MGYTRTDCNERLENFKTFDYRKIAKQALNLAEIDASRFDDRDNYYDAIEIMAEYYKEKFEELKTSEDTKRYAMLRDILLVAPAVELPSYLGKKIVSDDIDEAPVIGFREKLNIRVNSQGVLWLKPKPNSRNLFYRFRPNWKIDVWKCNRRIRK
jgi:hypothetical protein